MPVLQDATGGLLAVGSRVRRRGDCGVPGTVVQVNETHNFWAHNVLVEWLDGAREWRNGDTLLPDRRARTRGRRRR